MDGMLQITVNLNGAAIGAAQDGEHNCELHSILWKIARKIDQGQTDGKVLDSNGNSVARFNIIK